MQKFTPTEYLQIDIASNFGLDKENWGTRLDWFQEHEHELEELVYEADEPAQFYAGVQAYRKASKGDSISYPISLDATASGAQLLSVLVGCRKSAALCNVVDTGSREDLYTNIYQLMLDQINDKSKIGRPAIKDAVMTSLYGSTAQPKKIFGEGELLAIFYGTMETKAPGIWDLNKALLSLWQPTALSHDWVLPDNFHVKNKVMADQVDTVHFMNRPYEVTTKVNKTAESGLSIGANVVHSIDGMVVREIMRRCMFDPARVLSLMEELSGWHMFGKSVDRDDDQMILTLWENYQKTGFLSARILDHLDQYNMGHVSTKRIKELLMSMPEKPFKVLAIHDCFRIHPNYGNDIRRQYNQILSELASSEILASIASQIVGHTVNVTKYDDIAADVLEADYALS